MTARAVLQDPRETRVTSPASGAGGTPDLSDYAPGTRSAQSEPDREASLAAIAGGGSRRLGPAVLVIAADPVSVVLDATTMTVALRTSGGHLASPTVALRRDAAVASGVSGPMRDVIQIRRY
jgi:hypothetical protein